MYLVAVAFGVVVLPALVLGPGVLATLATRAHLPMLRQVISAAYWPVILVISLAALASVYHASVPIRRPWRRALPGALVALVLWIGGTFGLRLYVVNVYSRELTYGALAAPVAILLFFYITALAVLLGAELNAARERLAGTFDEGRPSSGTRRGRRRAAAADATPYAEEPRRVGMSRE
jgi:membrane protein